MLAVTRFDRLQGSGRKENVISTTQIDFLSSTEHWDFFQNFRRDSTPDVNESPHRAVFSLYNWKTLDNNDLNQIGHLMNFTQRIISVMERMRL